MTRRPSAFPGAARTPSDDTDPTATESSVGVPDEVVELARAGDTTKAISMLRMMTGATLLEAKKIVDSL